MEFLRVLISLVLGLLVVVLVAVSGIYIIDHDAPEGKSIFVGVLIGAWLAVAYFIFTMGW